MADFTFATLRLGKTSVEEIKRINSKTGGASTKPFPISVVCTQIPTDLDVGVIVFIWLGSDNSKALKQSVESPLSPEAKSTTMKALLK